MQFQKKEKRQTTVRFDSHHVRLRTGEVQRKTGSYMYRWTDKLGKRNTMLSAGKCTELSHTGKCDL